MAEQEEVVPIEAEGTADLLDLVDEPRDGPEVSIIRLVAVLRPELVVQVVLDAGAREVVGEPFEVLVCRAWAAVEEQELRSRVIADSLRPDPELALRGRDRDHPDAVRAAHSSVNC